MTTTHSISYIGFGQLVKFKNDSKEYVIKNVAPDRKNVFVLDEETWRTHRRAIKNIVRINLKEITIKL